MTKTVLITGGNGFIGSHLTRMLLKLDFNPILFLRNQSDLWRIRDLLDRLIIYREETSLEKIFENEEPFAVINLATYYKKTHILQDLQPLIDTNITFPTRLLELSNKYGVEKFLTAGSYFQYSKKSYVFGEEKFIPRNLYASTKSAFDMIMKFYKTNSQTLVRNLVLYTPYGPMDHIEKLIPYVIKSAVSQKKISLSNGFQKLNPVFVEDIAEAFIRTLDAKLDNYDDIYLRIAGKKSYSIREIVSLIEEIIGYNTEKVWGSVDSLAISDDEYLDESSGDTYKAIKWRALTDICMGLRRTIDYYREDNDESNSI